MGKLNRSFVLLSGGIDSTTCLYMALNKATDPIQVKGISIDYGQRHKKEIECAKNICEQAGIEHHVIDIGHLLGKSLLTSNEAIPDVKYDEISGISPTYVPFRNGLMLSVLAAYAQEFIMHAQKEDPNIDTKDLISLYIGTHAEDAKNWAYPDCTPEFIGSMSSAIYTGTYYSVRVIAPILHMTKTEIIHLGDSLGVPYNLTWSCYAGGEQHCGACPTCYARQEAFIKAAVYDPTEYGVTNAA